MSTIKDKNLATVGQQEVDWAARQMKVLEEIKTEFSSSKPLNGLNIGACMHVTKETANLVLCLKAAGANVALCASNPLSTKDSVAAYLSENDIEVHAVHGVSNDDFFKHLNSVLDTKPDITMDDGADLVTLLLTDRADIPIMGSMEETTTGVIRLKSMEKNNKLRFPVVAVNDSETKHLFDNRFGTGQSAMDGVVRATDLLIAGLDVVVIGFGDCGKGVAERAYGMGAKVTVVEPNSVRALEALMHGYEVKSSVNASKIADVIVSVTGNMHALDKQHFDVMKDGVVLANAGHFDVEINLEALKQESAETHRVRDHVESYLYDGKEILVLAEGRLVNLDAHQGIQLRLWICHLLTKHWQLNGLKTIMKNYCQRFTRFQTKLT